MWKLTSLLSCLRCLMRCVGGGLSLYPMETQADSAWSRAGRVRERDGVGLMSFNKRKLPDTQG